jgi:carboxymethylenebutenolidase
MPAVGGPFPVVLVAAEVFGLNPYIRDVCRRLAKAGYYAIVPDLYTRKADLTKFSNIAEIMPIVNSKHDTELVADYDATVEFARASAKGDVTRMAITGFCRGGRTTLVYAAANPKLKAAAAWYGAVGGQVNEFTPRTAMDRAAEIKVPILGLYGAKDAGIPADQVEKFFAALKADGTPAELVMYPEAGHGFHADFRPDNNAANPANKVSVVISSRGSAVRVLNRSRQVSTVPSGVFGDTERSAVRIACSAVAVSCAEMAIVTAPNGNWRVGK